MTRHLGLTLSLIALDKPWAPSELAFLFLLIFLSPCAPFGQVYKSTDFQCPLSSGYIPTHSCSPTLDHHLERSSFQQRLPGAPTLDGWDQMDQNHPSHPCHPPDFSSQRAVLPAFGFHMNRITRGVVFCMWLL